MTTGRDPLRDRWPEVDALFTAALDLPPDERRRYIEVESGADADLVAVVLRLLRAEQDSQGLFEAPGHTASQAFIEDLAGRAAATRRIGPYTVIREIGRGGMGTVFLAERAGDGFHQQAAIKVLRRGVDTDDVLRRFVTERRILASLSHPNIARLYDGGATDDGRPYLAMEFVEGERITTYSDRHTLAVRERLQLLLEVADAVRAAHAKLVVHRDLKPSNILVTADRRVKLLDFGIAKLLDADDGPARTRTGSFLLTPDHASPEQLRGDPVTTATDVYQLGVLLFLLLTGQPPYRAEADSAAGLKELADRIQIPRLSAMVVAGPDTAIAAARRTTPGHLRRTLAGDLDTIVRRALQAEPERRYASVEELAGDLRRFLDGRPIAARPDTVGYRTRMFLRRHPWVAPAAVVVIGFAVIYGVTLARHTAELERERNAATAQAERAQEVQRFMVDLFASADPYAPADPKLGRQITVVEALDLGVDRLKTSLADRPVIRAAILSAISSVYQDLGVFDRALPLRDEALALQRAQGGPASRDVRDSLGALAAIRTGLGELDVAGELDERRLALALDAEPVDVAEVADARQELGRHLVSVSRPEEASAHFLAVMAMVDEEAVPPAKVAEATRALADVQRMTGHLEESETTARRALALTDAALGASSAAGAFARGTLAQTLGRLGRVEEADALFQSAVDTLERTLGPDNDYRLKTLSNLSVLRLNSGNLAGAEALLRQIVEISERVLGPRHPSVGDYLQNHATVLVRMGRLDEARAIYERVADIYQEVHDADNYIRALPLLSLSGIHLTQGHPRSAERTARAALGILDATLPAGDFVTAVAACRVGRALAAQMRPDDAVEFFDRSTPPLVEKATVPEYRTECLEAAAAFYLARGDSTKAAALEAALGGSGG